MSARSRQLQAIVAATFALALIRFTALANLLPMPLAHVSGPLFGWIPKEAEPLERFTMVLVPLPGAVVNGLAVLRTGVLAAGLLLALFRFSDRRALRICAVAATALLLIAFSQSPFLVFGTQELLLVAVGLLAFLPASADDDEDQLRLHRGVLVSVYLWAAFAKMTGDWWDGSLFEEHIRAHNFPGPLGFLVVAHPVASARGAFVAELVIPVLLAVGRTRRLGVAVAVAFHVALEAAARPDVIALVVALFLAAFLERPRIPAGRTA
jgi:hypothetical protein